MLCAAHSVCVISELYKHFMEFFHWYMYTYNPHLPYTTTMQVYNVWYFIYSW
jgi:hypothetical protein